MTRNEAIERASELEAHADSLRKQIKYHRAELKNHESMLTDTLEAIKAAYIEAAAAPDAVD